eukprot:GFKZ01000340.1.p1 GENE.GFKZ01000340.1~~GFKZ01000340.1.p1  ORF type:complete len:897 (+),score=116.20 GFKZ01000340.1:235-2925(+)
MRPNRRTTTGRPPATPALSGRPLRRRSVRIEPDHRALDTPAYTDEDDSPTDNLPPNSYVPYAHLHPNSVPRIQPAATPYRPTFPRPLRDQPLASPPDRHDDSISSGYGSNDQGSDSYPHDDDHYRLARQLPYVDQPDPSPRKKTMPETFAVAKDKLRRRLSSHTYAAERKNSERSSDIVDGPRRHTVVGRVFVGNSGREPVRDLPSSTATSSSCRQGNASDGWETAVKTRPWVLEGNGAGLPKNSSLGAWKKKIVPPKTVRVEANPCGLAPVCLYASDEVTRHVDGEPYKKTEFITARPSWVDPDSIVYRDSPFEIGVVGMSVSRKDSSFLSDGANELLMYSLHRDPEDDNEECDALPYIHYDPAVEDKFGGTRPDNFIPIPASKSLFMVSDGARSKMGHENRRSVNVRFKILEIDQVDDFMRMSLAGIEELGNYVSQFSRSAPLIGLLSPALSLASTVSRRAIESHARPDKVINTDMNFLLAEPKEPVKRADGTMVPFEHRSGEYLRYGYYFFLEKPVDATLYASFRTFPNVELMLQRTEEKLAGHEKRYFPLTGVSYLVIRVTPRISSTHETRKPIRMTHVQRIEDLLRSSLSTNAQADAKHFVRTLADLAKELGIPAHRGAADSGQPGNQGFAGETNQGPAGVGSQGTDGADGQRFDGVSSQELHGMGNQGQDAVGGQASADVGTQSFPGVGSEGFPGVDSQPFGGAGSQNVGSVGGQRFGAVGSQGVDGVESHGIGGEEYQMLDGTDNQGTGGIENQGYGGMENEGLHDMENQGYPGFEDQGYEAAGTEGLQGMENQSFGGAGPERLSGVENERYSGIGNEDVRGAGEEEFVGIGSEGFPRRIKMEVSHGRGGYGAEDRGEDASFGIGDTDQGMEGPIRHKYTSQERDSASS